MKMKIFIDGLFLIILFALFSWQTFNAAMKYLDRTISTHVTSSDDGMILFPSITVCKKYFHVPYGFVTNISNLINHLHDQTYKRNEVFYFVSHTNMFNLSFPCNTMEDRGNQHGKPCSFPYRSEDVMVWGCERYGVVADCKTRYMF